MIYLITGVPGSGKTLKMISDLMNRKDLQGRPLYLDGIPEVKGEIIPNLPIPDGETMQTWYKWAPPSAILVIDECQRVFRPRPSGSKVPEHVSELETHRHKGIDIFLLTQHPRLLDSNVRALVGHHCHISKTNMGFRRMLEWERCADPTTKADVAGAVTSVYTLDKKAYGVYKSAEEHTKIRTKLSRTVYVFPIALAVIIGGLWTAYSFWRNMTAEKPQKPPVAAQAARPAAADAVAAPTADAGAAAGQYPPQPQQQAQAANTQQQRPHLSEEDYKPVIDGQPHTAPIYDQFNKAVKTMPYPVACVKNENRCTCYTEQGTPIKGFSKTQCLEFVKNGIYNPYKAPAQTQTAAEEPKQAESESGQVLTMGGESQQNLMYDGYSEKALTNQGAKVGI